MRQWCFVQGRLDRAEYAEFVKECAKLDIERREAVRQAIRMWLVRNGVKLDKLAASFK